nr:MAG TPA: hypothetical protein [Caudoviricetes sp.]
MKLSIKYLTNLLKYALFSRYCYYFLLITISCIFYFKFF